jgi:hypothetical protein
VSKEISRGRSIMQVNFSKNDNHERKKFEKFEEEKEKES